MTKCYTILVAIYVPIFGNIHSTQDFPLCFLFYSIWRSSVSLTLFCTIFGATFGTSSDTFSGNISVAIYGTFSGANFVSSNSAILGTTLPLIDSFFDPVFDALANDPHCL